MQTFLMYGIRIPCIDVKMNNYISYHDQTQDIYDKEYICQDCSIEGGRSDSRGRPGGPGREAGVTRGRSDSKSYRQAGREILR